ncbi:hypothetical protein [Enterococcus sp.]|uniref:hypothetical protein n=1 Tax=Enterococcus sp. TaxID=35783 RepID=UPI002907CE0D|nr:hypothetical protein [Enterococcus sp.]MDU5336883.1 hypothetical protein [Enterococcus sp.]
MEKPSGRSSRRIFFNCLKTVAFLIWATCPILLLTLAIGMEYQTVIEMKWFISIAITGFIFFSIYWIWNYYKRHTTQTIQKIKIKDFGIAIGLFLLLRIVAVIGTLLNQYFTGNTMTIIVVKYQVEIGNHIFKINAEDFETAPIIIASHGLKCEIVDEKPFD